MARSMLTEQSVSGGMVTYLDAEMSGIGASEMCSAGLKVWRAFPDYRVEVTAGPWRSYDVAYHVNVDEKRIKLDFYSVRPGLGRMAELIAEVRQHLAGSEAEAQG